MKVNNLSSFNPVQLFRAPFQQQPAPQSRAGPRLEAKGQIPKTPSLLFEIELEDAPVPVESREDNETQGILTNFRSLAVPWSKTEHELLAEWVSVQEAEPQQNSSEALTALAKRLRSKGYPVSVRSALGGGWGGECLRNLRHSFLVCTVSGEKHPGVYIIDPAFREQFDLAHATPRYQQILEAIPSTFVGTEARLVALVCALCQEIQSVFLEQNATLPPWRDVAAQLSKWRPRRSMDHPIMHSQDASGQDAAKGPKPRPSHDLNLIAEWAAGVRPLALMTWWAAQRE
ncbi:hypothetical protein WJX73_005718 [Symbiochloris irregularis]|uniref:Uncharacterized protein n=1 Tax=Symbiochloris irregularis TaxID=706552 RepID=A0AAW1NM38_9CHLO